MKNKKMLAAFMFVVVISTWAVSVNAEEVTAVTHDASAGERVVEPVIAPVPVSEPDRNGEAINTIEATLTAEEAMEIARNSGCVEEGEVTENYGYNEYTGTWWIDLDSDKTGCNPACVVSDATGEAEVSWRCTGAMPEPMPADAADRTDGVPHDGDPNVVIGLEHTQADGAELDAAATDPLKAFWHSVVGFFQGLFSWLG